MLPTYFSAREKKKERKKTNHTGAGEKLPKSLCQIRYLANLRVKGLIFLSAYMFLNVRVPNEVETDISFYWISLPEYEDNSSSMKFKLQ